MATETGEKITDPERLSRLEGARERMATKADLAALETRLTEKIVESEIRTAEKINASERRLITWAIGIAVSSITALAGIAMLLYRLLVG